MASEDLITGQDILHAVLLDVTQTASDTDDYATEAKRYIREAYWDVLSRANWPWALNDTIGVVSLEAQQSVTSSSISGTTVTLGATITDSQAGKKFQVTADLGMYRISAHTGGTNSFTLDASYVDATTTSSPAVIYQDEYALDSTVMKVWGPFRLRDSSRKELPLIDEMIADKNFGFGRFTAPNATLRAIQEIRYNSSGVKQIRIVPPPLNAAVLEYNFCPWKDLTFDGVAANDTPLVPREYRTVLVELAQAKLGNLKDDPRAAMYLMKAEITIQKMLEVYLPDPKQRLVRRDPFSLPNRFGNQQTGADPNPYVMAARSNQTGLSGRV